MGLKGYAEGVKCSSESVYGLDKKKRKTSKI